MRKIITPMKKIISPKSLGLIGLSLTICVVSALLYAIISKDYGWLLIIWNCFLAVLPLCFALTARFSGSVGRRKTCAVFYMLWLLFFPNSPYMLTDLKYLCLFEESWWLNFSTVNANVQCWLFLGSVAVCVACGVGYGFASLYIVHRELIKKMGILPSAGIITAVAAVSSFGIYIGRFPRLNSWDILRPWFLLEKTIESMTPFTLFFTVFFTLLILSLYALFYLFCRLLLQRAQ